MIAELSNEYQHDRVQIVFKNICVIVLWMKVALALEGLNKLTLFPLLHVLHRFLFPTGRPSPAYNYPLHKRAPSGRLK